jgi:lipopolysaccharide/colanic/teichoic acid biosynthesis glycosyltransferase
MSNISQIIQPEAFNFDRRKRRYQITKRLFDVAIATCVLVLVSPLILIGALLVKLTSPGPVFYKAKRAGLEGRPFDMLKLRTMHTNTDTGDRKITATEDDRITLVGRLLRKLKIDELPQLWNVLRGDMSIVGPRPEDWDIVNTYYTPEQRLILKTLPGIACPVDVRWYPDLTYHDPAPANVSIQEWYISRHLSVQVAEGIRYIEQQNLLVDLKVIGQTIFCVLVRSWLPPKPQPLSPRLNVH